MISNNKEVAASQQTQNKEAFVKDWSTVKDMRVKQASKSRGDGPPSMIDIAGIASKVPREAALAYHKRLCT